MRFLSIRIEHQGSPRLGSHVAGRRVVGMVLAAIPFGLGFLGIVTRDDQRGFRTASPDTDVDRAIDPWRRRGHGRRSLNR